MVEPCSNLKCRRKPALRCSRDGPKQWRCQEGGRMPMSTTWNSYFASTAWSAKGNHPICVARKPWYTRCSFVHIISLLLQYRFRSVILPSSAILLFVLLTSILHVGSRHDFVLLDRECRAHRKIGKCRPWTFDSRFIQSLSSFCNREWDRFGTVAEDGKRTSSGFGRRTENFRSGKARAQTRSIQRSH